MSTFINNDITNAGRILLARAKIGKSINFTRIVLGDGYLPPDTAISDMTDVINPVVNVPISKKKTNKDGTSIIGGRFSNADILTEFFYRELSLYAEGEGENEGEYESEILFCYGNAGDFAERIMPIGGSSVINKSIDIVMPLGISKNIKANIVSAMDAEEIGFDDSFTKLGAENLQEAVEILVNDLNKGLISIEISGGMIETPGLYLKLISEHKTWIPLQYVPPPGTAQPINEPLTGMLVDEEGNVVGGKVQLDGGSIADLVIITEK